MICGGSPTLEGTRLTCANVVYFVKNLGKDKFLQIYPYLTDEDVAKAVSYCRLSKCEENSKMDYCSGCELEEVSEETDKVWELAKQLEL